MVRFRITLAIACALFALPAQVFAGAPPISANGPEAPGKIKESTITVEKPPKCPDDKMAVGPICVCPPHTKPEGDTCKPVCPLGKYYQEDNDSCVCPPDYYSSKDALLGGAKVAVKGLGAVSFLTTDDIPDVCLKDSDYHICPSNYVCDAVECPVGGVISADPVLGYVCTPPKNCPKKDITVRVRSREASDLGLFNDFFTIVGGSDALRGCLAQIAKDYCTGVNSVRNKQKKECRHAWKYWHQKVKTTSKKLDKAWGNFEQVYQDLLEASKSAALEGARNQINAVWAKLSAVFQRVERSGGTWTASDIAERDGLKAKYDQAWKTYNITVDGLATHYPVFVKKLKKAQSDYDDLFENEWEPAKTEYEKRISDCKKAGFNNEDDCLAKAAILIAKGRIDLLDSFMTGKGFWEWDEIDTVIRLRVSDDGKKCQFLPGNSDPNDPSTYEMCTTDQVDVYFLGTPVSLEWTGVPYTESLSWVSFKVVPGSTAKIFSWRGSAETPLLVFDPERTGKVTDGSMLFGDNFQNKKWKHGYEALATLDSNKDGVVGRMSADIELRELDGVSLWFDRNRNGVSEGGEVVSAREAGLQTLTLGPLKTLDGTKDLAVAPGFTRIEKGRPVTGRTVDWMTEGMASASEALLLPVPSGLHAEVGDSSKVRNGLAPLRAPLFADRSVFDIPEPAGGPEDSTDSLSGMWSWTIKDVQGGRIGRAAQPKGMFLFSVRDGELRGKSMVSVPAEKTTGHDVLLVPLKGAASSRPDGSTQLEFSISSKHGASTTTTAVLSADGYTLTGRSKTQVSRDAKGKPTFVEYDWIAEKSA